MTAVSNLARLGLRLGDSCIHRWNFRLVELLFCGTFVLVNDGIFVHRNFRPLELLFSKVKLAWNFPSLTLIITEPLILYVSGFQPFCCSGTLIECQNHSRNLMHWSMSLVSYARLKLQGVYCLISLPAQNPHEDDKAGKDDHYDDSMKFNCISRQQYVTVFNQTWRAKRSSTAD